MGRLHHLHVNTAFGLQIICHEMQTKCKVDFLVVSVEAPTFAVDNQPIVKPN
jgi:hypothetical protein